MKVLVLLCSLLALTSFAPKPKLNSVKVVPGLSVGVPQGFTPLPDEGIAVKFPSPRKPLAVYSSPNGKTDYSVAVRPTMFGPDYSFFRKSVTQGIEKIKN